jgi:type I restriction enzyme R subunit
VSPILYTEDTLVQQTTAEYLERELRWESVYAYNQETFGPEGSLRRAPDREAVRRISSPPLSTNPQQSA